MKKILTILVLVLWVVCAVLAEPQNGAYSSVQIDNFSYNATTGGIQVTAVGGSAVVTGELTTTGQAFTASWVDLGSTVTCSGYNTIALWTILDINDTLNPRFRALAKLTAAATDEYAIPIKTISSTDTKLAAGYYEWNVDADQKTVVSVDCDNVVPFVQFQISAGTAGASPGEITSSDLTWGL